MTIENFEHRAGAIWLDGRLVKWPTATLHVLSHGLHYATSVFEGERVYSGRVFKLAEHTARLIESARLLGFRIPFSQDRIEAATIEVVATQGIVDGYVRPIAWLGSDLMGIWPGRSPQAHLAIATWPWPNVFSAESKRNGIKVKTARWLRPAPASAPVQAKASGLYTICVLSRQDAVSSGFDDALMLDYRGNVAEVTGANIFMVNDGALHTPTTECVLAGITRQTVITLARRRGIVVHEREITPDEIAAADEVFVTGTAYEIQPVSCIDQKQFACGPMTYSLGEDYGRVVRNHDLFT